MHEIATQKPVPATSAARLREHIAIGSYTFTVGACAKT
jgi:hypothetical protein